MIKARHHMVIYPIFKWLTRFLMKRNFHKISIEGEFTDMGKALLVIANHISWWDGFWILYLNLKLIHKKFHFMMLEEQLRKHWYFQHIGGYSVKKGSRSIIDSLNYTSELLKTPGNMVFMFPQGEIKSLYQDKIKFEKGVQKIVEKNNNDFHVLFMVNLPDYFSKPKPGLFMYLKTYSSGDFINKNLEKEYFAFYNQSLEQQKNKIS